MLMVQTRDWYDQLRKQTDEECKDRPESDRLIRQFLRGDAEGPLTARRDVHAFEADLLGEDVLLPTPSISPTRVKKAKAEA
jgi:hypothetical protein